MVGFGYIGDVRNSGLDLEFLLGLEAARIQAPVDVGCSVCGQSVRECVLLNF